MKSLIMIGIFLLSTLCQAGTLCIANQGQEAFQPNCTQIGVDNCDSFSNICHLEGRHIPVYNCVANQGQEAFQPNCTQIGVENCDSYSNICHLEQVRSHNH